MESYRGAALNGPHAFVMINWIILASIVLWTYQRIIRKCSCAWLHNHGSIRVYCEHNITFASRYYSLIERERRIGRAIVVAPSSFFSLTQRWSSLQIQLDIKKQLLSAFVIRRSTWSKFLLYFEIPFMVHWFHSLQWRHNGHDGVSNQRPVDCLLNRLFRRRSKKTSKLRVTGLFVRGIHRWPMDSPHKGQ